MAFAFKAEISDLRPKTFAFICAKDHVWRKHIAEGDTVFVFESENEGGQMLTRPRALRDALLKIHGRKD